MADHRLNPVPTSTSDIRHFKLSGHRNHQRLSQSFEIGLAREANCHGDFGGFTAEGCACRIDQWYQTVDIRTVRNEPVGDDDFLRGVARKLAIVTRPFEGGGQQGRAPRVLITDRLWQVQRFLATHDKIANVFTRRSNPDTAAKFHSARN